MSQTTFLHEALFYEGLEGFVDRTGAFVREGLERGEAALVVVGAAKIEALREELGAGADNVRFADMAEVGKNPARIIPAWHEFATEQALAGRAFRGVGEPIWVGRGAEELAECERHESLLNLAFAQGPAWRLACPYDVGSLDHAVLQEATRNHPVLLEGGVRRESASYAPPDPAKPFDRPLSTPPGSAEELEFEFATLGEARSLVRREAADAGLAAPRVEDLVLAAAEVASNSVRHGGGRGTVRVWSDGASVLCEIRDAGSILDPLAGRVRPASGQTSGFGLWLVHQLCDLVQLRSTPDGSIVRLHMSRSL